jgi:hypothetical protein
MSERAIRIVNDPADPLVLKVVDAATGEPLKGVYRVTLEHTIGYLPRAWIEFFGVESKVEARLVAKEEGLARRYLERLGKMGHPDAGRDPVGALGQVAVDLQQALTLKETA